MNFLLILFFGSLLGITFMIGRKLVMLQNGQVLHREELVFKTPYLEEWKHLTIKNVKKHGYNGLVTTIRFYVRSINILKNKYHGAKSLVNNIRNKNPNSNSENKREISKFLKIISEYKYKIREIKRKVKKEENL
jgi:hypothetical protein